MFQLVVLFMEDERLEIAFWLLKIFAVKPCIGGWRCASFLPTRKKVEQSTTVRRKQQVVQWLLCSHVGQIMIWIIHPSQWFSNVVQDLYSTYTTQDTCTTVDHAGFVALARKHELLIDHTDVKGVVRWATGKRLTDRIHKTKPYITFPPFWTAGSLVCVWGRPYVPSPKFLTISGDSGSVINQVLDLRKFNFLF